MVRSSWPRRSGSATRLISTIVRRVIVKVKTTRGRPPGAQTAPAARHASDDRRQPSAEVLNVASVAFAEPKPAFLDGVIRLVLRAEHPERDRPQVSPVRLESLCQPLVSVHWSHSLVGIRHSIDEPKPADVTRRSG